MKFKIFIFMLFCFFNLCTACASTDKHTSTPSLLSSIQLARIDAVYSYLEKEFKSWGLSDYGQDCILLFAEKEEWLLGCPMQNNEFKPNGQVWRGQAVLWHDKSLYVTGKHLPFDQIKNSIVGTVGNYKNDQGVTKPVLVLQDWGALHSHHPAFVNSSSEEWLGIFVHEAFHARQMWHTRIAPLVKGWESDTLAKPEDLVNFYKNNPEFQKAINKEYELLRAAIDSGLKGKDVQRVLVQWLKLYQQRLTDFKQSMEKVMPGKQAWRVEQYEIFIEGTARYVEAKFLIAADGDFEALSGDPSFKNFASSKGKKPSELPGLGGIGSRYFYSLGMYLSFLMDKVDPSWKKQVFDHDQLLINQVRILSRK
jgi:hypothetical protein